MTKRSNWLGGATTLEIDGMAEAGLKRKPTISHDDLILRSDRLMRSQIRKQVCGVRML